MTENGKAGNELQKKKNLSFDMTHMETEMFIFSF